MRHLAVLTLAGLAGLAGCFLPVGTGAPLPATTVGHGHVGVALSGEAPTIDLIANNKSANADSYTGTYGQAPAAAMNLSLAYGITDDTDLEASADGELWFFFLPLPTGGSIGVRHHVAATDVFDFAIAARFGGVSSGTVTTDASGNSTSDEASAIYGALQGVAQLRHGVFRPLLALNLMPFKITRAPSGEPVQRFSGLASSLTLGLNFVLPGGEVGPFVTFTDFASTRFAGGTFVSGGLMFSIRPDRNRAPPAPPPPAYAPPGPPGS